MFDCLPRSSNPHSDVINKNVLTAAAPRNQVAHYWDMCPRPVVRRVYAWANHVELHIQSMWNTSLCIRPGEAKRFQELPDLNVVKAFGLPILQGTLHLAFPIQYLRHMLVWLCLCLEVCMNPVVARPEFFRFPSPRSLSTPSRFRDWPHCDVLLNHQCLYTLPWFMKAPPAQPAFPFPWSIPDRWVLLYGIHFSLFFSNEIKKILCSGSRAPNPPNSSAMVAHSDFNPFLHSGHMSLEFTSNTWGFYGQNDCLLFGLWY